MIMSSSKGQERPLNDLMSMKMIINKQTNKHYGLHSHQLKTQLNIYERFRIGAFYCTPPHHHHKNNNLSNLLKELNSDWIRWLGFHQILIVEDALEEGINSIPLYGAGEGHSLTVLQDTAASMVR